MKSLGKVFKRGLDVFRVAAQAKAVRQTDDEHAKQAARKALAGLFSDARGVTMKFGQLMAGDGSEEGFSDLVSSIEPLPLEIIQPVVEESLGKPVSAIFTTFEESQHAASLGQVHRATLRDGQAVAVKVQYPDIADSVAAEMTLFGLMPGVGPVRKWGFDLDGYKHALADNMERELDYRDEGARQVRMRDAVCIDGLVIPRVHEDLTTRHVLVQDWESGDPLITAREMPSATRAAWGRILVATLLKSVFDVGEIHGDPHPGNYAFRSGPGGRPEVVLMDFGCTVPVDRSQRLAALKTLLALREGTDVVPLHALAAMGFDAEKLVPIAGPMATMVRLIFEPFSTAGVFDVRKWNFKARFETLLGENRWWFRSAGPPSHILLLRGFYGLTQQLAELDARLDWYEVLCQSVDSTTLDEARRLEIPPIPAKLAARADHVATTLDLAKNLHVRVREGGETVVDISMPAEAALNLRDLIPEDVLEYLEESGEWDLDAIFDGVRARGVERREIMAFDKGARSYRIWLD